MSEKNVQTGGDLEGVLAQVSNQLRSSLGNIYNALSRIAPPELRDGDTGIDRDAAVLCQSYYRILRLANNLSDAANLEGPSTAKLCNGDLVGLCRDVMRRAELPAQLLGIQLSFQCGKASHIVAMDGERLECLLLNLLSNAFKFIRADEKPPWRSAARPTPWSWPCPTQAAALRRSCWRPCLTATSTPGGWTPRPTGWGWACPSAGALPRSMAAAWC